jgi:hypothetical protein
LLGAPAESPRHGLDILHGAGGGNWTARVFLEDNEGHRVAFRDDEFIAEQPARSWATETLEHLRWNGPPLGSDECICYVATVVGPCGRYLAYLFGQSELIEWVDRG